MMKNNNKSKKIVPSLQEDDLSECNFLELLKEKENQKKLVIKEYSTDYRTDWEKMESDISWLRNYIHSKIAAALHSDDAYFLSYADKEIKMLQKLLKHLSLCKVLLN